jgi:hypothetical protein
MKIPDRVIEELENFHQCAGDVDEWITVKKHVVNSLPSNLRRLFTRRDEKTKHQHPNEFEYELMSRWAALTERSVIFNNNGTQGKIDPP